MKKIIIATVLSLGLGFGVGYGVMNHKATETNNTLWVEVQRLEKNLEEYTTANKEYSREFKALKEENKRLLDGKNGAVMFGVKLCKTMKEQRECLMELALKSNSPFDIKD
ncbi:hypothetical protein F3Q20_02460 [Salmonella enterica subsp. enterica]|nr:hypothetical protein [Salmonella enterica subsp. enterica]